MPSNDTTTTRLYNHQLEEQCEEIAKAEPADVYEDEGPLYAYDVTTYHIDSDGLLKGVTILVAGGGPDIVVDSHLQQVRGHWGSRHVTKDIRSDTAEAITEYYGELTFNTQMKLHTR